MNGFHQLIQYLRWVSNNRGKWRHPPYNWLVEGALMGENDLIRTCYNQRKWRNQQIKAKLDAVIPNVIKRDYLFSEFLGKADFTNFIHLRWKDVIKTYDYNPMPTLNKGLAKTPNTPTLPPVKYRGLVKFSPESLPASDPKPPSTFIPYVLPPIKTRAKQMPDGIIRVGNLVPQLKSNGVKKKKNGGTRKIRRTQQAAV